MASGREYVIEVWVNGRWEESHRSVSKRSTADGLLNQFGLEYRSRLLSNGKPLRHSGVVAAVLVPRGQ